MTPMFDLVIRNGMIVDGSGEPAYGGDVAISNGKIMAAGVVLGSGLEEIDATGLFVTPGFVDIHTHYDGQVTWESQTAPSSMHGVTTVVMGNCGVGFAPCKPHDRERLVALMEGIEDIPGVVMAEGLAWNWESFSDYLDVVASRPRDVDVAAQLPHSCLRVYVMGERATARDAATPEECRQMGAIAEQAMRAGALGFATSRSVFHNDRNGEPVPTRHSAEAELLAIAKGMQAAGHGVIEALFDFDKMDEEFAILRRVCEASGCPVSFSLAQTGADPELWRHALALLAQSQRDGLPIKAQVMGRPTGLLFGLDLSYNPFSLHPTYQSVAHLPLTERLAKLREAEIRDLLLTETPGKPTYYLLNAMQRYDLMYPLGDPPNYEPPAETSIAATAQRRGVTPARVAYDILTEGDGTAILNLIMGNYVDGTLEPVLTMLKDDNTVLGLGDGGAHYGMVCDAGYPTFMLTYWTRDRTNGERLSVPKVVRELSYATASAVGLHDRGLIRPGYKADINLIDYERLALHAPKIASDLPAGGRRLHQQAAGYVATIVAGVATYRNGLATGALPGRLVRGPVTLS